MRRGLLFGISTYILWGFLPVYWKALQGIPALEILGHRTVWSFVLLAGILTIGRNWRWVRHVVRTPKTLLTFSLIAALLAVNWLTYIWAVNAGFIIETSLGYFINPLVNVLLGMLFLGERLRPWQWAAVGLAAAGVLYLTLSYGALPWIALVLAFSFGFYGLLKKTASLGTFEGLTLETAIMFVPALLYLLYQEGTGVGAFGHGQAWTTVLLIFTGVVTAVPLLLFAAAARRIPLSMVGLLQYIAPSIQFLLGMFVYQEPFSPDQLIGFALIWTALIIYTTESIARVRRESALRLALQNTHEKELSDGYAT